MSETARDSSFSFAGDTPAPPVWSKAEALVQLCEWLTGYIEELRDEGNDALADNIREGLLRPALCALDPIHERVAL